MSSSLEKMMRLIPPPERPYFAEGDWEAVEKLLGTRLPDDYKALLGLYGAGSFSVVALLLSPFLTTHPPLCLFAKWAFLQELRHGISPQGDLPPEVMIPFPIYPEKDGCIPFALDGNGYYYMWCTCDPDPNRWTTRSYNIRDDRREDYAMGAVPMLVHLFEPPVKTKPWEEDPEPIEPEKMRFFPWDGTPD